MKILQIILLVLIIIGLGLIFTQKFWVDPVVNFILEQKGQTAETQESLLYISTTISGRDYALVNGRVEKEIVSGGTTKEVVEIFGQPVYGDLNGDGMEDAAMFLVQNSGGSGTFFYVVLAINEGKKFRGTNAMLLGDRIAPQNINIIDGRAVANFAERKPGEPMTAQPSVGKSIWVHLDPNTGEIGEWIKDFEGETR